MQSIAATGRFVRLMPPRNIGDEPAINRIEGFRWFRFNPIKGICA